MSEQPNIDTQLSTRVARITAKSSSFLTRTRAFKKLTKWAFGVMDENKSGSIGKSELYTGLLLIHLSLAKYAGPSACKPPSREVVEQIFEAMDDNSSGQIDEHEFTEIMVVLCSEIAARIILQYSLIIILVPQLTSFLLKVCDFVGIDELVAGVVRLLSNMTPGIFKWPVYLIPSSIWDSLPFTIISSLLVFVALPVALDLTDEHFRAVALKTRDIVIPTEEEHNQKTD